MNSNMNSIKQAVNALTLSDLVWVFKTLGDVNQLFSHTSVTTKETIHVDVAALRSALGNKSFKGADLRFMGIPKDLYDQILEQQGIEQDHLARITPDAAAHEPALILEETPQSHIIIDGNHRIIKAYQIGLRSKPAIFVTPEAIAPFLHTPPERVQNCIKVCNKQNVQFATAVVEELKNNPEMTRALKETLGIKDTERCEA